jgi:hypothetical protein
MLMDLDVTSISAIVAAAGVLIGVAYYMLDLRHNAEAKEMELSRMVMLDIQSEQGAQRWATTMNLEWKDYDDFMEKYSSRSNPEIFSKWSSQFMTFDTMGFLIKHKVVKAETVYELGGATMIRSWEKYKDIIQRIREEQSHQDFWSNAEFYAREMLRIKMKRDAASKKRLRPIGRL